MGYLQEKYTREYFLGGTDQESGRLFGVDGYKIFQENGIDRRYLDYVLSVDFKDKVVLDVGCGRGEVTDYVAKHGAKKVIAFDFSPDSIKIAKERNQLNSNVQIYVSEAIDLNFQEAIDIVFLLDVLEHIPDLEMQQVYLKIVRALKKDGVLWLNTPIYKSVDAIDESDLIAATRGMHCNKQTRKKLEQDLKRLGLRKYSLWLWSKSSTFSWRLWFYAIRLEWRLFYSLQRPRLLHPVQSVTKLIRKIWKVSN